jgi:hypothetical protein
MPYDPLNAAHVALINELEFRCDEVIATTQAPAFDRSKAYEELADAAIALYSTAPVSYLADAVEAIAVTDIVQTGVSPNFDSTIIPLPTVFLRLVRLQVTGWMTWIFDLTPIDSPVHRLQHSAASRADRWNPVGVLIPYFVAAGRVQAIECWPSTSAIVTGGVIHGLQEKAPELVPAMLRDALLWLGVSRMMGILGDLPAAELAQARYGQLVGTAKVDT